MSQTSRSSRARRLAVLALLTAACGGGQPPITGCEAQNGIEPLCGFQNPEDLAKLPDSPWLVVSQMRQQDTPGSLVLYDTASGAHVTAYPGAAQQDAPDPAWGDPTCPGPIGTALEPGGLDLHAAADGWRLLVANHGSRESIEWFALDVAQSPPTLTWKGCALAPPGDLLNDVAAIDADTLVTTRMVSSSLPGQLWALAKSRFGLDTGHVLRWSRDEGFAVMPGSSASLPNGIAVSERWIFVNAPGSNELLRFARSGGEPARAPLTGGDNLTWTDDGRLLAASIRASLAETLACFAIESGSCPIAFAVVAIEPESLVTQVLLENAGPPMGGGTVALQRERDLWIGTYAGDRIARVPGAWPPSAP
jgi:hypothetical protein